MHEAVEQDPPVTEARLLVGIAQRGQERVLLPVRDRADRRGVRGRGRDQRQVADIGSDRRLERGDADQAKIAHLGQQLGKTLICRVVALHRADHQTHPGALGGRQHRGAVTAAERHRLLHQQMHARAAAAAIAIGA